MTDTNELTPGDRRELRSLIKKQFAVLRNDVKRRKDEMAGEIEMELLRRYHEQDARIEQARREVEAAATVYRDSVDQIMASLRAAHPDLKTWVSSQNRLFADDPNRAQLRQALIAKIPQQIADASSRLDQLEIDLLRDLTTGGLDTAAAHKFLARIPTVGELVPAARLAAVGQSERRPV